MKRLLPVLLVSACGSTAVLDRELPKFVGQPVSVAVDRFGLPTSETVIMGQKVYVWTNSEQVESAAPVLVPGRPMALAPVATVGTCVLRLAVDGSGIVRRAEHQGDSDACYRYSNRLKRQPVAS